MDFKYLLQIIIMDLPDVFIIIITNGK